MSVSPDRRPRLYGDPGEFPSIGAHGHTRLGPDGPVPAWIPGSLEGLFCLGKSDSAFL